MGDLFWEDFFFEAKSLPFIFSDEQTNLQKLINDWPQILHMDKDKSEAIMATAQD